MPWIIAAIVAGSWTIGLTVGIALARAAGKPTPPNPNAYQSYGPGFREGDHHGAH